MLATQICLFPLPAPRERRARPALPYARDGHAVCGGFGVGGCQSPHSPLRVTPRLDRGVQGHAARPEQTTLDSAIKSRNDRWGTKYHPYPSGLTGGSTLGAGCRSASGGGTAGAAHPVPSSGDEWALRSSRRDKGIGKQKRQMACKPGSVPAAPEGGRRWPFICDACCQTPGATNPDSSPETGHVPSLFGLAPGGVYRAASVARRAVRSYRTLSPLPAEAGGLLSVALSLGSPPPDVIRHRVSVEPGLSSVSPQRPSGHLADAHKPERRSVGQGWGPTISPCGGPRLCPCSGHSQYQ